MPAVDDRRLLRVGALEEEEVVADQLHLVEGLVDGHGSGGMVLLPDDLPRKVLVEIGHVRTLGEAAFGVERALDGHVDGAANFDQHAAGRHPFPSKVC